MKSLTAPWPGWRARAGRSWPVSSLAVLGCVAMGGIGLAAPGGAAAATGGSAATTHFATVGTHYAVTKRLCTATPKPGFAACMAMRLVPASKATPGAHRYVVKDAYPVGPSGHGYTPGDFGTAYGFDPASMTGASQTIAIVDAYDDPAIASDLATFDTNYGLAAETLGTTFEKVSQTGSAVTFPAADTSGWSGEEALDVETARGVCNLCKIILVEANSPSDANLAAGVKEAVALGATEVSNSYGGPEDHHWSVAKRASYKKLYNFPGVVVTASTGDDGWFSWDVANNGEPGAQGPNVPATLPTVVAVGGTSLGLTDTGTRASEQVWNDNGPADSTAMSLGAGALGASGGGCSVLYQAPRWQAGVPGYTKTGCGKTRLAADVSADGDPETGFDMFTSYNCGDKCAGYGTWQTVGGTSLSSPLIASMWALAGGSGDVAYPALSLYGHAFSAIPPLFDVKSGGNSWCDQDPSCAADTRSETHGEPNPNHLCIVDASLNCITPLKVLDCGFVRKGAKATPVADNRQCEAAKGYDGPSGVGAPSGLDAFTPIIGGVRAKIHPPSTINAKSKAIFKGGGHDPFPGGSFVKYAWKWGDGRKSTVTSAAHPHVYARKGHYTVTLTVTDPYGHSATTTAPVTVHKPKRHHKK